MNAEWLLLIGPLIGMFAAVAALLPGGTWPIELVTRGAANQRDAELAASFAFVLASLTSAFLSVLALLARVSPRADDQTDQAIIAILAASALFVSFLFSARISGLTSEQIGERIWFGFSPKYYAVILTLFAGVLVFAAALLDQPPATCHTG